MPPTEYAQALLADILANQQEQKEQQERERERVLAHESAVRCYCGVPAGQFRVRKHSINHGR